MLMDCEHYPSWTSPILSAGAVVLEALFTVAMAGVIGQEKALWHVQCGTSVGVVDVVSGGRLLV